MDSSHTQRFRHDIRGALNVIRLHAELLQLQPGRDELPHIVQAIERAILKIEGLVDSPSAQSCFASFSVDNISLNDCPRSVPPRG